MSLAPPEILASTGASAGPAWFGAQRRFFAERAAESVWPSPDEEIWRYSRIAELDPTTLPSGSTVTTISGHNAVPVDESLQRGAGESIDVFADLAFAWADPIIVRINRGQSHVDPIVIEHLVPSGKVVYTWLVVEVAADADVSVVERFTGGSGGLVVSLVELRVASAGRVRYQSENLLADDAWLVSNQSAIGERDSTIRLGSAAFGGHYARVRTDVRLVGQGAHAEQVGFSFGEAHQMHDFRVSQTHSAPRTTSDLLFKSAVEGSARSVYTGMIHIEKTARGSTAFQTNRIVKLSEAAWAESVPNLDIENNDVRCSHASTVGPVDPEQRFYLESRGIPPLVADRLIVLGFFDDVIARLPVATTRAVLRENVAAKLDRRTQGVSIP